MPCPLWTPLVFLCETMEKVQPHVISQSLEKKEIDVIDSIVDQLA